MMKNIAILAVLFAANTALAQDVIEHPPVLEVCTRIDAQTLQCTVMQKGEKPTVRTVTTKK